MNEIPLKPENETFTDKQWQSVFDGDDNLLISASAGSGKTTVLVRRVIEKLKSGSNIDELLIVTFTEAAAREMKERIQIALQDAVNQESDQKRRSHFTKQLTLLPMANISTLHAFCLTVIRRFYFLIDIDPVFRMLTDETETLLLKEEVWENVRDNYYEVEDEAFFQLAQNFSNDRSDEGLTDLVMSLYAFARANPDPKQWLKDLSQNYETSAGLAENRIYKEQLKPILISKLTSAVNELQIALEIAQSDACVEKAQNVLIADLPQVERLLDYFAKDALEMAYTQLESLSFGRYPSFRKEEQKELSEQIKPHRQMAKDLVAEVQKLFAYAPEKNLALLDASRPLIEKMSEVTLKFLQAYQARKQSKGVLDFNDLEHYALQILRGNGSGSEAAVYYRRKFTEVLVDEYQDVNRLQEAILTFTRRPENTVGNFFMVGDVKQSIYAFRLADPTLFIDKYLAFEKESGGRRIILAENFRSRKEVLDFTNLVFEQLMDENVGQIPYDKAAHLIAGFEDFPKSDAFATELLLFEKGSVTDLQVIDDKTEGEISVVALKIKELIDHGFEIYDKKTQQNRLLTYRDIVLLTPTRKNNLVIMDVFKKYDIPIYVNDAQNYFQATEIQTMIALLQIIDNPYQDIPFVAVLRSPIVGLSEEELAQIRLGNKQGDFYVAFKDYLKEETDLAKRLRIFAERLADWREMARRRSLTDLLWQIYKETAYLDYVIGLPSGKQRYANLLALVDRAESYEKSSFRGLYQFIRFIEKMQEKDKDLAEPLGDPVENAVRIMTVHASKGLEFPVVFLLDMTKQFNMQDVSARYIFEERLGAGIQLIDHERVCYDTLPYQAIKEVRLKKALSEEMRKLYVACTRAEQKLFLVGSYKSKEEAYKKWQPALRQKNLVLDVSLRSSSRGNMMDWVGLTLMRHPDMKNYFSEDMTIAHPLSSHVPFKLEWYDQEKIQALDKKGLTQATKPPEFSTETRLSQELHDRLTYAYPAPKSTQTTSYQSVSEMKRLYNDPDDEVLGKVAWQSSFEKNRQQFRYTVDELPKPAFLAEKKVEATAVGTATHTVLQLLDLTAPVTEEVILEKMTELVTNHVITKRTAQEISISAILWFFETALGQALLADPQLVHREQPFSMIKEARNVFLDFDESEANLLVHGIIDGYIAFSDHLVLYDFKTDAVYGSDGEAKIVSKYLGQLRLYKEALEESLEKPVTEIYLVLLNGRKILSIKA